MTTFDRQTINRLSQCVSEDEIIGLISDLVKIPSYIGLEAHETEVARYIHRFFQQEGIESELVHVCDGRYNVVARLRGKGAGLSLLLTGHIDTVPPYDMPEPFSPKVENGKLIGRGTTDMKGAVACMMMAMVAIKRAEIVLKGDVVFAGVVGEESDCQGTMCLLENGLSVDGAVVGESTNLDVVVGHRGLEWLEFSFQGKAVHGGKQSDGINAIDHAILFGIKLKEELVPKLARRTHPIIGQSSMNFGVIRGGTQPSTVAHECVLQIDRRWVPKETHEEVIREYQDILDRLHEEDPKFNGQLKSLTTNIEVKYPFVCEAMEIEIDHPLVSVAQHTIETVVKKKPALTTFSAWTDGGLLHSRGHIPTIVLGPGDIESAHTANEFLEVSQVLPCTFIYAGLCMMYCE